jgi:hypothetical protein
MRNLRITVPDGRELWVWYLAAPTLPPIVTHLYTSSPPFLIDQTYSIPRFIVRDPSFWSRILHAIQLDMSREQHN